MSSRIALAACLYLASCASIVTGNHDVLSVHSTPNGARFTTDTGASGVTPAQLEVVDNIDVKFSFELEGFQPAEVLAEKHISGWIWGNILIGGIIGLIIDVASGGMHTHDGEVHVTLLPITP